MRKNRKQNKNKWYFVAALFLVAIIVMGIYIHYKDRNSANLINSTANKTVTGTTSTPTTHSLTSTNSPGVGGGVVDNNGQTSNTLPPSSDWVSSDSGNITLQQPSPNTVVKSGDVLSGLAKGGSVQFTLTDDSVGLIAQGNLSVVNGKFSGTLQFTPHSTGGKLEIYYPNPSNGAEEDIVEISVDFSN